MAGSSADFRLSTLRESIIEHLFVGQVLRSLWLRGPIVAEVMKPQVDANGYDIAIECWGVLRHVQLKSSIRSARTARQKLHVDLQAKPSGCVVWVQFDPETLELGPFLFFGSEPGHPLPSLEEFPVARHTKANADGHKAERPEIRVVPKGKFLKLDSIEAVVHALFGEVQSSK